MSRNKSKKSKIREYFYGRKINQSSTSRAVIAAQSSLFSPARQDLRLSTLRLVRAGGIELSDGMKLLGETPNASENVKLTRVQVSNDLVHSILAVLHIAEEDEATSSLTPESSDIPQQLLSSNIAGFLWIVQMDIERDIMTVLAPCPGALPSKYLLVGSIKWVEQ